MHGSGGITAKATLLSTKHTCKVHVHEHGTKPYQSLTHKREVPNFKECCPPSSFEDGKVGKVNEENWIPPF